MYQILEDRDSPDSLFALVRNEPGKPLSRIARYQIEPPATTIALAARGKTTPKFLTLAMSVHPSHNPLDKMAVR